MALSPSNEKELFVTTGASHSLVQLELTNDDANATANANANATATLKETARFNLGREPRAVLVSRDGERVFVSHANESFVSVLTRATQSITTTEIGTTAVIYVDTWPARVARHAQSLLRMGEHGIVVPAAQALTDPPEYRDNSCQQERLGPVTGYGTRGGMSVPVFMDVTTLDDRNGKNVTVTHPSYGVDCLLPRATASAKDHVYVTCLGSARIDRLKNPHGQSAASIIDGHAFVPTGPSAIAAERDDDSLVVWSSLARTVTRLSSDMTDDRTFDPKPHKGRETEKPKPPRVSVQIPRVVARADEWLRGRELFVSNTDSRISNDKRACASCHIDGRDDGLAWQTPKGPRRTRTIAGELTSAGPYGWLGENATLEDHVKKTIKNLGGSGLPDPELQALISYARSLPKPKPAMVKRDDDNTLAVMGKGIFTSAECNNCHAEGASDRTVHDVGTGGAFMTPTLSGVGSRKKLTHDGRFASLDALLTGTTKMGNTSSLSPEERRALITYLETL